jgi:hypothetical protein
MSETVTVTEVGPTNQWGYAEVKFAERGPAKTKNSEIIARATEMVGQAAPAVINEVQKGQFTNVYLNEFAGVKDAPPKGARAGNGGTRSAPTGETNDARQKNIEAQWANGRAVELLIGSGVEYSFPLDQKTQDNLAATAKALLDAKNTLAAS